MRHNKDVRNVLELLVLPFRVLAQVQSHQDAKFWNVTFVVAVPVVREDRRVPEQRDGTDGVSLLVWRYELALQAFAIVEVEELLNVELRSLRQEFEIVENADLLA